MNGKGDKMSRKKKSPAKPAQKFKIIRDNREKVGYWNFISSVHCSGTEDGTLTTGDYTIEGMKDIFAIERKKTTGELSGNVLTKQFVNELKRSTKLKHFYIICEFSLQDIISFPYNSGIPNGVWKKLKVTGSLILKKIVEFETQYNCHFIFAGNKECAREIAKSIFKEMWRKYAPTN